MSSTIIDAPLIKNETPFHLTPYNFGEYLKQIREANELSVKEVAMQLRLKLEIIHAIESDDYNNAPEPIFIRGYLRAYSRLLNISEDMIIELYNQKQLEEGTPEKKPRRVSVHEFLKPEKNITTEQRPKWIASVVFLIFGLGTILLWWMSNHPNDLAPPTPTMLFKDSETTIKRILNIQSWLGIEQQIDHSQSIPLKKKQLVPDNPVDR